MLPTGAWISELDRPRPYQEGAPLWTDPHIAGEMLRAHLSPDTDAASYRPDTVRAICDFLPAALGLRPGADVADLGCGPGLYSRLLAEKGFRMTGIDWSENSIRYAREQCAGMSADFVRASYLEPFGRERFDAALLIYQDFGVLSPENRKTLLRNVRASLRPSGRFALDVAGLAAYERLKAEAASTWESAARGFWRPHPYVTLHTRHFYPELCAMCDLYAVLDGAATVYRVWQTFYTPESIARELDEAGFGVLQTLKSLQGGAAEDAPEVLGVICEKR